MKTPAPSSIPSGNKFAQRMADQKPRYESRKMFRRKLRRGRPAANAKREYWVR
jgi:hypothetical protein